MGRLNFDVDEATLLKAYRISSLNPTCVYVNDDFGRHCHSAAYRRWEDVDHEQDGSAAGSLADGLAGKENADFADPLGLNDGAVEQVFLSYVTHVQIGDHCQKLP